MRQSRHFGLTLKDDPKEAQTPGHRLLLRAGYIRQLSPGLHAGMPFLRRVLDKIGGLVRAELSANAGEELLLPVLQPQNPGGESPSSAERSGKAVFTFKDRRGSVLGIGCDSEVLITSLAKREIRSYKDLPKRIFQVRRQFQDEPRTRQGLVNDREFLLHETYSLDADAAGLQASYEAIHRAFQAVLKRLRLDYRCAEASPASDEGCMRHTLVALTENGSDTVVACDRCGYAATRQTGRSRLEVFAQDAEMKPMQAVYGPGLIGVGPLAEFIGIPVWKTTKTLLFQADDRVVAVMVRGDCDVNEDKVKAFLRCRELTLAAPQVITELTGAEVGYAGGVGLPAGVSVLADHFTRERINFECGANRTDYHNINVNWGRDLPLPTFGDFKTTRAGDPCACCEPGRIREMRGIEVGGLAARGTAPAETAGLTFQDPSGKPQPVHMGIYWLNLSRLAAALVEQHHDDAGLRWPASVAPFRVHLIGLNLEDEDVRTEAESIYRRLQAEHDEVLYDDRNARAGEKFSDSDLLGIPVRLTISKRTLKEGQLELKLRGTSQNVRVTLEDAMQAIKRLGD
jgi:prolyl-tRNA synthetase